VTYSIFDIYFLVRKRAESMKYGNVYKSLLVYKEDEKEITRIIT
jgi:hypothetical protein